MRIASPPRFMTVVRTDKETRLKDFIIEGAERTGEASAAAEGVTLVVRNPDSPVARALFTAIVEGRAPSAGLKVIFGEALQEEPAQASILDVAGAEFRTLNDARLGAAHEQLVVGDKHIWIGDCLRRDPTKRDAFEIYHSDGAAHLAASVSFRNLWAIAQELARPNAQAVAPELIASGQAEDPNAESRVHRH